MENRPNILFIMTDQLSAAWMHFHGGKIESSPTLNILAEEGMVFDRCYASHPVCSPNRATLLTGRSAEVHGIVGNNYVLREDTPTFADVLRYHGYRTGGFGKFHLSPQSQGVQPSLDHLGFDEWVESADFKWGPWLEWVKDGHPEHYEAALDMCWGDGRNKPGITEEESQLWEKIDGKYLHPAQEKSGHANFYVSPLPPEVTDTTFVTDKSIEFLREHKQQHNGKPFLCYVSYVDPHDPIDPPEPYASMFDPADMPEPKAAEWKEQGPEFLGSMGGNVEELMADEKSWRQMRAWYQGSIRLIDDNISRLIDTLKELGEWDNTILVFTSDHGDMLGDHGFNGKGTKHYDSCIRVPLLIAGPGIASGRSECLTCTLDFFPTLLDWAGIAQDERPPLEGRSLASAAAAGKDPDGWPAVRCSISTPFGSTWSVVTEDNWRLTWVAHKNNIFQGDGQLFNLEDDPDEQNNLYHNTDFAEKKNALYSLLVSAQSLSMSTPQYRNMAAIDGAKRKRGRYLKIGDPACPVYPKSTSPFQ